MYDYTVRLLKVMFDNEPLTDIWAGENIKLYQSILVSYKSALRDRDRLLAFPFFEGDREAPFPLSLPLLLLRRGLLDRLDDLLGAGD